MDDFGINEMLEMQRTLQDKYKDIWEPICPERGKDHRPDFGGRRRPRRRDEHHRAGGREV